MNERLYFFNLPDGSTNLLTIADARKIACPTVELRIKEIFLNSRNKKMNKDGFESGWQENIQEHVGSRGEYDRRIKELGLVEIGYDYVPQDETKVGGHCNNIDFAKHAKEIGVELNDQEMDAIADGSYFDSSKCDLSED